MEHCGMLSLVNTEVNADMEYVIELPLSSSRSEAEETVLCRLLTSLPFDLLLSPYTFNRLIDKQIILYPPDIVEYEDKRYWKIFKGLSGTSHIQRSSIPLVKEIDGKTCLVNIEVWTVRELGREIEYNYVSPQFFYKTGNRKICLYCEKCDILQQKKQKWGLI